MSRLALRLFTKRGTGEHAAFVQWAARRAPNTLFGVVGSASPASSAPDEGAVDVEPVEVDPAVDAPSTLAGFSAARYFAELRLQGLRACGRRLLYAPVVTSTQSLLTGPALAGLEDWTPAFVADEQTTGKGRGGNTWTSPRGCLMCSFQYVHTNGLTLAMVQYVVALAIVRAVKSVTGPQTKYVDTRVSFYVSV